MLQVEQILNERYQLQRQLGRTAAGRQTWLALDLQTQESIIVKLLAFSPQMQWEEFKLFEREAQVLQALNHSRIPRYRDYFSIDQGVGGGIPWFGLVQDYIPGHSLQELLEQGKHFSERQVRTFAIEVLEILTYLHELSPPVLHRDIKPSNLMLDEHQHVYLVDFGAVQAQAAVTGVTFTVVGTSGYAPLEQFWGRAVPGSDLYALGATLIHLLTGVAPAELPQKNLRIQFADRVSLNPSFVSWIDTMTESAVEKRFAQAKLALKALESNRVIASSDEKRSQTLRKLYRPAHTRIEIDKLSSHLEVFLPAPGWNRLTRSLHEIGCAGGLFIYCLMGLAVTMLRSFPVVGLLILSCLLLKFIFYVGQKTYIRLDHHTMTLKRQVFGLTYGQQSEDINNIVGVFLHGRGTVSEISIQTPQQTYYLGGGLSNHESAWLAQEIQHWLNYR